jgi:hypothetical protein
MALQVVFKKLSRCAILACKAFEVPLVSQQKTGAAHTQHEWVMQIGPSCMRCIQRMCFDLVFVATVVHSRGQTVPMNAAAALLEGLLNKWTPGVQKRGYVDT